MVGEVPDWEPLRQAGAAIEGVVRQERIETSQLAVDTHGYTDFAMALSTLCQSSFSVHFSSSFGL